MKQKRLSKIGIVLVLLLAFVVVACGPAIPPGMEDEYTAIMNGEEAGQEDAHGEEVAGEGETADPHQEDAEAAPVEAPELTTDLSAMPPISDRMLKELAPDEYTETETGLKYYDLVEGEGISPEDGSIVQANYAIWVLDDVSGNPTVIDDSFAFGQPLSFIMGSQQVFPGWEEGMLGMKPGGSRQLMIPPALAFGEEGIPGAGIGPETTIVMEVELLDVQPAPTAEALTDDDYETTDSGLKIAVLNEGSGEEAAEFGDTITVEFTIWVADGERFFTGTATAGQPFTYPIGSGAVFPGWDEGVTGMTVGEKRQLLIPSELGLGSESVGEIVPANADLLMQVELLDLVKPRKATEVDENDFEVTDSGLKYYDLVEGDGAMPETGQTVVVHYTGWLEDGTQFDSSLDRGQPFPFAIGTGAVIPGWDEGVATMKVGGVRQLVIPSDLAYGDSGSGAIPPGATLIFEVELLDLE
ncbi:MAG: FKBP-type peptidyl-prolyl cis-trans isomerase [Anaerolineae bacterium]|nr:FKBP-type peptidyl-prolyl cis-trans isomerase [Anaerolineae bacterium]